MANVTPVFVFNSLNVQRGGLTKAVITRANMLAHYYPEVHFCTMDYQPNHLSINQELKEKGILDKRVNVHYFYHDMGLEQEEYEDMYELNISWLNQKAEAFEQPVFMSDSWFTDEMVAKINSVPAKRITVIHNNHFEPPYTKGSELDPDWNFLYAHMNEFNRIVFLTNEQKEDISEQFGHSDRYRVISHAAAPVAEEKKRGPRNPKLVVSVARYAPQKRIDEAIKAFSLVVKEIPDAEYHVYGYGPQKEELEILVKKLHLVNNVFLKDFSSETLAIFGSAACSILTSDYEGFGLVLTESLSAGTPVVAYDIKYGPKDIIRNNFDGYLIEKGNQAALAEKVIAILKDSALAKELSHNAKEVVERFSFEHYTKQWIDLFEGL